MREPRNNNRYVDSDEYAPFCHAMLVVGKDIQEGQYVLRCQETTGYSAEILVFVNQVEYLEYHKMHKVTNGEYQEAIDAHAIASKWLQTDDSFATYLDNGAIILITGGFFSFEVMQ